MKEKSKIKRLLLERKAKEATISKDKLLSKLEKAKSLKDLAAVLREVIVKADLK